MSLPADISLCAIYRNEERRLGEFLSRHTPLFAEIILVDTGSQDRSNTIVKEFGLASHYFPWCDNFSTARNHSLSLAKRPFICVLDIDEVLLPKDLQRVEALLAGGNLGGLSLCQLNLDFAPTSPEWCLSTSLPEPFCSLAKGYTVSRLIRVFRNDPRVRFEGVIHEIVGNSLHQAGYTSRITDIPIYHLGWITSDVNLAEQESKHERYRDMIRQAYAADPSPQNSYYYLTTLTDPQERLRLAYTLNRHHPQIKEFHIVLASAAAELGQWPRALQYARRGLEHFPTNPTLQQIQLFALIVLKETTLTSS